MLNRFLFKQIDNSPLIVFRIIFGLLLFLESVGAIFTGWITKALVEPKFTFTFIGFEWLQPLPGYGMYIYYAVMGIFGLMVMLGYRYRLAIVSFTLMWVLVYLMQKTYYNNHYYFLILLSLMMIFLPAHKQYSLDAKKNPSLKSDKMSQWCVWIIILQVWIVYTFASVAKLYPDWLDGTVVSEFMSRRADYPVIGDFLQQEWVHFAIIWFGIFFDLLIVPLLLFEKTRRFAFGISIFFHLFNSIIFQVGIFPYLSLAFTLFFFEPRIIAHIFLKRKEIYTGNEIITPRNSKWVQVVLIIYFLVQIVLPLRHWLIPGDVLLTEEGHRMSWRMKLRIKKGVIQYKVLDKKTEALTFIDPADSMTAWQAHTLATKPDFIWQFAQRIKKSYQEKGVDVSVFAIGSVSINNKPYVTLINPDVDLASEKWHFFRHNSWVTLPNQKD